MSASETTHYLSLRVGKQWYGIDLAEVNEVLHMVALADLPIKHPDVVGLITVRGLVFPVIDLRVRFMQTVTPFRLDTPIIAVRTLNRTLGLLVDEVDNVERVAIEQIQEDLGDNGNHAGLAIPFIRGIVQLPNRMLLLLDLTQLSSEAASIDNLPAQTQPMTIQDVAL